MVLSHQVGVQKRDKMKLMAISAGALCSLWCDYMNLIIVKMEQLFCYEMKPVVTLCDFFSQRYGNSNLTSLRFLVYEIEYI